ncbi:putative CRAL-TRIO lipid binding domain-containing protein [Helianthus annuus]|nr:putative CRAL-TRIO lipid binding domain-containing protein [Helianthus annuus]
MDNQIKHLVYLMENAMLNLPEGQEEMAWLIDFTGWSFTTSVPVRTAKDTINILQDHYPQRLAVAFLYAPPRIFEAFWKVCRNLTFLSQFLKALLLIFLYDLL